MVHILGAFTDYERVTTSLPLPSGALAASPPRDSNVPRDRVALVLAMLSAIPENLAKGRYRSKLASWVAGIFSRDDQLQVVDEHTLWNGIYKGSLERHLRSGVHVGTKKLDPQMENSVSSITSGWKGRMLCTFGFLMSESFALSNDREQVRMVHEIALLWTVMLYLTAADPQASTRVFLMVSTGAREWAVSGCQHPREMLARALPCCRLGAGGIGIF